MERCFFCKLDLNEDNIICIQENKKKNNVYICNSCGEELYSRLMAKKTKEDYNAQMSLNFDDYMYLMDCCVNKKQLKAIKKAYIKKGFEDECFYVEYGLDLTEEEQKEFDKTKKNSGGAIDCFIKVKFEEDEVINEFTHFITYNGSSLLSMLFCGVMD